MRVDCHLHFFSRPFFEALARQSPLPGSPAERLARLAQTAGIEIPEPDLDAHRERWAAALSAGGMDHAWLYASLAEEAPAVGAAVAADPARFTGLCLLDPRAPGAPSRARALLSEEGFRGLLFFPALHRYRLQGPELARVLGVLGEHGGIAVVHCGLFRVPLRDLLGLPRPYDLSFANPLDLIPAANAHPGVAFVVPHFGAGFLRETLMAGQQCENVYVDTSSGHGWLATQPGALDLQGVLARVLGVFGPRRVLFGTDSSTFPRGWRADLLPALEQALDALGLAPADRAAILGENAGRLARPGTVGAPAAPPAGAR